MNDLKIFSNSEFGQIRTMMIDGEPWFVGKDVAESLGYKKPLNALNQHVECCDSLFQGLADALGRIQQTLFINESGVYSMIFGSKLKSAIKFKRWVTSEVLPAIRKTGAYRVTEIDLSDPEHILMIATKWAEEKRRADKLSIENKEMKPKALFADAVATAETTILIGELAKIIKQNGVEIGQNRLFAWMRDHNYLINRNGQDYNMPSQKSMNMGLMEIKERVINNPDGSSRITKTTKVTGKGQQYFINKFLKKDEKEFI